ncbi:pentatricopeptide repeat-containing protein At2g03880, mitochondrial-like [Aristolochia californica]|uniref:pentatricopeptide repeat-containing protein At2g03880, mitochondrial-like n=1 Tax=Aristolochia californica TaxID=171875 RepID=UPI0035D53688
MEVPVIQLLSPQPLATFSSTSCVFPAEFKFRSSAARNVTCQASKELQNAPILETSTSSPVTMKRRRQIGYYLSLIQRARDEFPIAEPKQIHAQSIKAGLMDSIVLQNNLAILYAKDLSLLTAACRLFDETAEKGVALYATLVSCFCLLEMWIHALHVFVLMIDEGLLPDKYLMPTIFKACTRLRDLNLGRMMHGLVIKRNLDYDIFTENSLVDMYAKCGSLINSQRVFDMMSRRDVVSWTTIVSAYADMGLLDKAMEIFDSMRKSGVIPDHISWNALIVGFAKNGEMERALKLLEELREDGLNPGISSWNAIIWGCVQNGCLEGALNMFTEMSLAESPNAVSIVSVLSACAGLNALNFGKEVHAYAIKERLSVNSFVCGSLIKMYSLCGKIECAELVFKMTQSKNSAVWNDMIMGYINAGKMENAVLLLDSMEVNGVKPDLKSYHTLLGAYARKGQKDKAFELLIEMDQMDLKPNVVSFNILISGFQHFGLCYEALKLFQGMQMPNKIVINTSKAKRKFPHQVLTEPIKPNAYSISSALSACSDLHLRDKGKEIHGHVLRNSFDSNVIVSSALVDMYVNCQEMSAATKTFQKINKKNTVTWNILLAGHVKNGESETALKLYLLMSRAGFRPNSVTLMILLSASSSLASWTLGKTLHGHIAKLAFTEYKMSLTSALVEMYAKCGSILEAGVVFNQSFQKDVALWNSMISAYANHGMANEAINLFEQLELSGLKPDHITFTVLLSACARVGLVELGWKYFSSVEDKHGIKPTLEHYTCFIRNLCSVGLLDEALDFVKRMPYEPDACVWATIIQGCRVHSNAEIGERAGKALLELEPNNASNYIVLSNIYAMSGMWNSAQDLKNEMRNRGLGTMKACSRVEVNNLAYAFRSGDDFSTEMQPVLKKWTELAKEMESKGYIPQQLCLCVEDEIDPFSCSHTEKIAICFSLVSSHRQTMIRVVKNLRMCSDCHTSAKFISKIERREIFVRDGSFYHHFQDGICSCEDKW